MSKTKVVCPHCNRIVVVNIETAKPWGLGKGRKIAAAFTGPKTMESSKKTIFSQQTAAPPIQAHTPTYGMPARGPSPAELGQMIQDTPANFSAIRQSLDLEPTIANQVWLPLAESAVFGFFVGGIVVFCAYVFDAFSPHFQIYFWGYLTTGFVSGFVATFYRYLSVSGFYKEIIQKVEEVTKRDINHDGVVGAPPPPTVSLNLNRGGGPGVSRELADLPGELYYLRHFFRNVVMGEVTFSELGATKSGYGQKNFMRLREIFLQRGWARWKNNDAHTEGIELLRDGHRVVRGLSKISDEEIEASQYVEDDDGNLSRRYAHIDY